MERQKEARNRIGGQLAASGAITVSAVTPANRARQIAGLYDLEETLGEGHYAVVKLASHVFTGEKVAVKVIDKLKLDAATRVQMLQEVQLMKLVQHPHVVRLYEVIDTQTKLYLVLEYADGGDMYDHIMKHEGGLPENVARNYFRQIVAAIQYCHRLHVVHRDLKPENVVFFEKLGLVKLTDFGFSNQFNPGSKLQTSCGSLAYSAPEILLGDEYDAPAVDIWSLGVILYMLVCGTAPFQEANDSETLTMIMDCKYSFPKHISKECKSLISRMLQRKPDKRATLDDIVKDDWLDCRTDGEGNAIPAEQQLPLVAKEHLSDDEHAFIINKMVNGNVASVDEIIQALDLNEYNHITATYFLLAERKLRAQRLDLAAKLKESMSKLVEHSSGGASSAGLPNSTSTPSFDFVDATRSSKPSAIVESLLSPDNGSGPSCVMSTSSPSKFMAKMRPISILEEEEEDEDTEEELPSRASEVKVDSILGIEAPRILSRHSSTSSLADKVSGLMVGSPAKLSNLDMPSALVVGLRSGMSTPQLLPPEAEKPPAPFPVGSQIGTGGLSRQNSLRRVSKEDVAAKAASPVTDRKSVSSSPSTPPGSTAGSNVSSNTSSPARFGKIQHLPGKKLVSTRSSPQLMLNQIHEESEEATPGHKSAMSDMETTHTEDCPVDTFPSSAAGAAVIKRLEQRRRLHKARAASCSSSDASDDDSEARQKKAAVVSGYSLKKRDSQHDDSSDSQDPGVGASGMRSGALSTAGGVTVTKTSGTAGGAGKSSSSSGGTQSSTNKRGNTDQPLTHHVSRRQHRHSLGGQPGSTKVTHGRIRQSHSLNRISELHVVADFSSDNNLEDVSNNNSSCPSSVASIVNGVYYPKPTSQLQPQLSSESDSESGARFDMLQRYLESISANRSGGKNRSRDDSQNSSDGEFDAAEAANARSSRRHKVNLRVLEQRLNKIQEECNKSADEEAEEEEEGCIEDDDDRGDLSDDVATLPDEVDLEDDAEKALHLGEEAEKEDGDVDMENEDIGGDIWRSRTILDIYDPKNFALTSKRRKDDFDETGSTKSCCTTFLYRPKNNGFGGQSKPRKPLHRAHSCGSLMGLKERTLLGRRGHGNQFPVIWDLLKAASAATSGGGSAKVGKKNDSDFTLQLAAATSPLTVLTLQSTSRCCSLC